MRSPILPALFDLLSEKVRVNEALSVAWLTPSKLCAQWRGRSKGVRNLSTGAHLRRRGVAKGLITLPRIFLLPALFALAACAHSPEPGVRVETVEVPVPQPCLSSESIPDEPPRVGDKLTGHAVHDLSIVSESALLLREWGEKMYAALTACAG